MKKLGKDILITGGAGYVGQNLINYFLQKNYTISVIDNLSTSKSVHKSIKKKINFFKINLIKKKNVEKFFKKRSFDLIIHLAAFSGVKEFDKNLKKSFNNNVLATKNIVDFGFKNKNTNLIFSSSAAVYGKVSTEKVSEKNTIRPANYYGLSKVACENIIKKNFKNIKNSYAILRYFNVVGSTIDFKLKKKINSLFDIVNKSIIEKNYKININGNKLNTKDGTPERDFIHVNDLSKIHESVYKYLKQNKNITLNCGTGTRYSVLEVIKAFEKKIKRKFKITYKVTNTKETHTICSNTALIKKVLKTNFEKDTINHLIKEYL
jgi:UDP-glucose 4-epimerase